MKTTLNQIRAQSPCADGWVKLLKYLNKTTADDEPLSLTTILESNGLGDTLWCLRAVEGFDKEKRLLAVAFAREVQHLMTDPRSIEALDVAERFANGEATLEELGTAYAAAYNASSAFYAASTFYAASSAFYAAFYAADASAYYAASASADASARGDMQQKQVEIFKKFMV